MCPLQLHVIGQVGVVTGRDVICVTGGVYPWTRVNAVVRMHPTGIHPLGENTMQLVKTNIEYPLVAE